MRKWEIHLCLQCPYSKGVYDLIPELKAAFGSEFDIQLVLTALPWHMSAYMAMAMAHVEGVNRDAYIKAAFACQERFMNEKTAALTRKQIFGIFADIAKDEAKTGYPLTKEQLVEKAMDWKGAQFPAWTEMKIGIFAGVAGTPKHVIDGAVVVGTDSEWAVEDYKKKIATLPVPGRAKLAVAITAAVAVAALTALLARKK